MNIQNYKIENEFFPVARMTEQNNSFEICNYEYSLSRKNIMVLLHCTELQRSNNQKFKDSNVFVNLYIEYTVQKIYDSFSVNILTQ